MGEASLERLARAIDGDVVVANTPAFDTLPRPFNARFDDATPQAVVRCTSADDVAETISFIRAHGLRSATRSGGHCFAGRSSTSGILIDVSPMRAVSITDGLARIGAGARLGEVYLETIEHGLTVPGGTCPSVGIAGLTLGGGLGILGRTYGVTSDRLVGARIVLADGRTIGCDEHHDGELFWALRGAGTGHLGVVTDLVFRPVPAPAAVTFQLRWPFRDAVSVARAWMSWSPAAPDAVVASLVVAAGADPEEAPEVEVFGTVLGSRSDARIQLEGITSRVETDPVSSSVEEELSYADTLRHWAARAGERLEGTRAEPSSRAIHLVKSEFFARPLPEVAISALFDLVSADRTAGHARELDLSPWGGAYNRIRADATAFVHRDAQFCVKHAATVDPGAPVAERAAAQRWVSASWASLHRWSSGGVFPNFPDLELEDWARAYYGDNLARLLRVKARYDPENVFRSRQSLPVG